MRATALVGALLLTGCGGVRVQTWVTTADHAKTLHRDPDVRFARARGVSGPIIEVDADTTYQRMIGFGAAMTDASAYVIERTMSATQREALLQDLFGRDPGIGLSFVRVPLGASDFSQRGYSYEDSSHFSIGVDAREKLPALRR